MLSKGQLLPLQGLALGFCPHPDPNQCLPSTPGDPPDIGLLHGGPSCPRLCPHLLPPGEKKSRREVIRAGAQLHHPRTLATPCSHAFSGHLEHPSRWPRPACPRLSPAPAAPACLAKGSRAHRCHRSHSHCPRRCPRLCAGGPHVPRGSRALTRGPAQQQPWRRDVGDGGPCMGQTF